jgi:hypothetical protein
MNAKSRAEVYTIFLESYPASIAQIMRTFIAAPEGGVVFHCHAGKDRTGTIAALLLDLVGVAHDQIAEDYALSQHYLPTQPWVGPLSDGVDPANGFWYQPTATAAVAWQMLTWIGNNYGGSAAHLSACGLSSSKIAALHARISVQP